MKFDDDDATYGTSQTIERYHTIIGTRRSAQLPHSILPPRDASKASSVAALVHHKNQRRQAPGRQ